MKKIISMLLCLTLLFSFNSCNSVAENFVQNSEINKETLDEHIAENDVQDSDIDRETPDELIETSDYTYFTEGFTDVLVTDEKSAIEAVASVSDVLGITDAEKELDVVSVSSVGSDSFYRMQQYYNGIPIYGKNVVVAADKNGNTLALTGNTLAIDNDVSLNPTITAADVQSSVQSYFEENIEIVVDDSNLVLYQTEEKGFVLAYELELPSKQVIIDATSSEILNVSYTIRPDNVECSYVKDPSSEGKGTFTGAKISENEYWIADEDNGLFVFTANNKIIYTNNGDGSYSYLTPPRTIPLKSTDNYFGNNDPYTSKDYSTGVELLHALQTISAYFKNINQNQETSAIAVINMVIGDADGNRTNESNAFGGYCSAKEITSVTLPYNKDEIIGILMTTDLSDTIADQYDTLGHEYTHGITNSQNKKYSADGESGAIDEAYADIFGELIEALLNSKKTGNPDWVSGRRDIADVHHYPSSIKELKEAIVEGSFYYKHDRDQRTDYSHFASTIISHSAYLMWNGIDGNESKKIGIEDLGKLWYRSILLMSSDPNFKECRNAVELSARIMLRNGDLTEEQYNTVVEAFEQTGIKDVPYTVCETVKNNFDLSVLSSKVTENVKYKLEVFDLFLLNITNVLEPIPSPTMIMEKPEVTGRQSLNLDDGVYVLRITDLSNNSTNTKPINIKINVNGNKSDSKDLITINTDFTDTQTENIPVQNESDTTTSVTLPSESSIDDTKITPDNLLQKIQGYWMHSGHNGYNRVYDFISFNGEDFGGGRYQSELNRPGIVKGIKDIGNGKYELQIVYPEYQYYDELLPETSGTVTILSTDDFESNLTTINSKGEHIKWLYAGKTKDKLMEIIKKVHAANTVNDAKDSAIIYK